jgi:hypothetical protein
MSWTKCRKCGIETTWGRLCLNCHKKWLNKRKKAYQQTKEKMGKITSENIDTFRETMKQIEAEDER